MSDIEVPLGFTFVPTDNEVLIYLVHKIAKKYVLGGDLVQNADIFGELPPWILFQDSSSSGKVAKVKYFFTALKKKGRNATKNFSRTVEKDGEILGTWKGERSGVEITDPKNKSVVLGTKSTFTFKTNLDKNYKWIMIEYSLAGENKKKYGSDFGDQYVICRIKKIICKNHQERVFEQPCWQTNMSNHHDTNVLNQESSSFAKSNSAQGAPRSYLGTVNNPEVSWSASNNIRQNDLEQFLPTEVNQESVAQEQELHMVYDDDAIDFDPTEFRNEILAMDESREHQEVTDRQIKKKRLNEDEEDWSELDELLYNADVAESEEQEQPLDMVENDEIDFDTAEQAQQEEHELAADAQSENKQQNQEEDFSKIDEILKTFDVADWHSKNTENVLDHQNFMELDELLKDDVAAESEKQIEQVRCDGDDEFNFMLDEPLSSNDILINEAWHSDFYRGGYYSFDL